MKFDAVLMAGGRSSRYGSDKALAVIDGVPLWRRQLEVLRGLNPAALYVSGREYDAAVEVLPDAEPRRGALSGVVAALRRCEQEYLLVLAVDLPRMTTSYLKNLLEMGRAVVPIRDGLFEPLAAVYPKRILREAEEWMREGDASFQGLLRNAVAQALIEEVEVGKADEPLFANMNTVEVEVRT